MIHLDHNDTKAFRQPFLTGVQRVFNAHQRRPVPIVHLLDNVILWNVGAPVLDANACAHVVEGATVQLKELNQQHAQVGVQLCRVLTRMQLSKETCRVMTEVLSD